MVSMAFVRSAMLVHTISRPRHTRRNVCGTPHVQVDLPVRIPLLVRETASCRIKRGSGTSGKGSGKGKRRVKGQQLSGEDENNAMRKDDSKPRDPSDVDALSMGTDDNLTEFFEEDVSSRLSPRRSRSSRSSKRGRDKRSQLSSDSQGVQKDIDRAVSDQIIKLMPKTREDVLNLLVRGAWVGVFLLVGLFLTIHLVVVRDWLPQ